MRGLIKGLGMQNLCGMNIPWNPSSIIFMRPCVSMSRFTYESIPCLVCYIDNSKVISSTTSRQNVFEWDEMKTAELPTKTIALQCRSIYSGSTTYLQTGKFFRYALPKLQHFSTSSRCVEMLQSIISTKRLFKLQPRWIYNGSKELISQDGYTIALKSQ